MTWTDPGKWSCPHIGCAATVVIDAQPDDVAWAIKAVQERHGRAHAAVEKSRTRKFTKLLAREQDTTARRRAS